MSTLPGKRGRTMQNHVLDYLDATVKRVPDKLAFADEEVQYTFRELDTIIKNTASCLAERAITRSR